MAEIVKVLLMAALALLALVSPAQSGTRRSSASDGASGARPQSLTRIVSLAPSNTELLYSLRAASTLVGVSSFCDYPAAAKDIPEVGSFTAPNLERLTRLKPQAVLLVSGQETVAGSLRVRGFRVIILDNGRLDRVAANLEAIGRLIGRESEAAVLSKAFTGSLTDLASCVARATSRPRVFYCVWPQPLMAVGGDSFLNDEITAAGGINIAAGLKASYPHFSTERLLMLNPDIIVMPHEAAGQSFLTRAPWTSLRAFRTGNVFFLPPPDKNDLARPTLRAIDGIHWLATRFHPEISPELGSWLERSQRRFSSLPGR